MWVHVPCRLCAYAPLCEGMCVDVCVRVRSLEAMVKSQFTYGCWQHLEKKLFLSAQGTIQNSVALARWQAGEESVSRVTQVFTDIHGFAAAAEAEDLFRRWELWSDDPLCSWRAFLSSRVQPEYRVLMQYAVTDAMAHLQRKLINKYCGSCAIFSRAFPPLLCRCQWVCSRV